MTGEAICTSIPPTATTTATPDHAREPRVRSPSPVVAVVVQQAPGPGDGLAGRRLAVQRGTRVGQHRLLHHGPGHHDRFGVETFGGQGFGGSSGGRSQWVFSDRIACAQANIDFNSATQIGVQRNATNGECNGSGSEGQGDFGVFVLEVTP